jgi:hypothetical protein
MTIPPVSSNEPGNTSPQTPPQPQRFEEPVPTYLAPSVFITMLCCLPAGLVAIYFASRVSSLQAVGNQIAAIQASDKAKLWCWIGGILGVIWPIVLLSLIFAGGIGLIESLQHLDIFAN